MRKKLPIVAVPIDQWKWFGQAGHFCAAHLCRYHLHTHVGRFCISTVGEYALKDPQDPNPDRRTLTPMGASDFLYETMVFELDPKKESPRDYNERETVRTNTREKAQAVHLATCAKYSKPETT